MLSAAQRKRLAKEARKLAMECLEGTAPEFERWTYCGCACAEIVKRGLGITKAAGSTLSDISMEIDEMLPVPTETFGGLVSLELLHHGPEGLPFPLLALADALEEAQS